MKLSFNSTVVAYFLFTMLLSLTIFTHGMDKENLLNEPHYTQLIHQFQEEARWRDTNCVELVNYKNQKMNKSSVSFCCCCIGDKKKEEKNNSNQLISDSIDRDVRQQSLFNQDHSKTYSNQINYSIERSFGQQSLSIQDHDSTLRQQSLSKQEKIDSNQINESIERDVQKQYLSIQNQSIYQTEQEKQVKSSNQPFLNLPNQQIFDINQNDQKQQPFNESIQNKKLTKNQGPQKFQRFSADPHIGRIKEFIKRKAAEEAENQTIRKQPNIKWIWNKSKTAWAKITAERSILTHGTEIFGPHLTENLKTVKDIFCTITAFVALLNDDNIHAWGQKQFGGFIPSKIKTQLNGNVEKVFSTDFAFSVLLQNGNVLAWGSPVSGGSIPLEIQEKLCNVKTIFSTKLAFAALLADGRVFVWGDYVFGGFLQNPLENVETIFTNGFAFVALFKDRSVFSWGSHKHGGNIPEGAKKDLEKNVIRIIVDEYGFSAITRRGPFIRW